jgi:glycerol-3-phosphate dehydrogenase
VRRREVLEALRSRPTISVLIVGGGINGAGLLRELALQGIDAILVDKADFCAGASAASSRMIHGGLRYLENGEFRLVRESLTERNLLLRNAAHYVKPLPTVIPIFDWTARLGGALKKFLGHGGKSGNRGALLMKIGLSLDDVLARRHRAVPRHRFTSRRAALALRPELNPHIVCTAIYYDAWITHPERLCLELMLDAETLSPSARALNYIRVENADGDVVTLRDEISGERLIVKPHVLVNATGAWIDFTNRLLRRSTQFIGGTKGSHLVIDNQELFDATRGQMLYYENADGRICLVFPFHDRVLAGSTDIPVDNPETVRCDDAEIDYILESIRQVLPHIEVNRAQVVFQFSGVRPLPRSDAATPGQISRDHSCQVTEPGREVHFPIYSMISGKWTTFRAFSEQVAGQILHRLNRQRLSTSEKLPIGGGKAYPRTARSRSQWLNTVRRKTGLPQERLAQLLDRYGTRAAQVATFIAADEDAPLRYHPHYSRREILFLGEEERVLHLDDVILRRTPMALLGQLNVGLLAELAAILGDALGWPDARRQEEITRSLSILENRHGAVAMPFTYTGCVNARSRSCKR